MFIAVEGTDASGKTSLCAEIFKQLSLGAQVTFLHQGRPEELTRQWVLNEYVVSIEKRNFSETNVVADRWHWGEVTYAPLKRPETCVNDQFGLLGVAGWRWVEMFLESRGVAQFWLYQPLEVIERRLFARGDDFVSVNDLREILSLYKTAAGATHSLEAKCTPEANSVDDTPRLAASIIRAAGAKTQAAAFLNEFPEYIGAIKPTALLVGGAVALETTILPFIPIDENVGEYLLNALPETLWRRVGLVNSCDVYNERFIKLWESLGSPAVIALGHVAAIRLVQYGVPSSAITTVPSPGCANEARRDEMIEYGMKIEQLVKESVK